MDIQQTTMAKSLLLTGKQHYEWVVEALPALGPHDILLQTCTSAISVGSELPAYRGRARTFAVLEIWVGQAYVACVMKCAPLDEFEKS
jgi:hypothetical protein